MIDKLEKSEHIGGPRHYEGAGIGEITSWKCPACAVEQVSDPNLGCPSCSAGTQRPYKVAPLPTPPRSTLALEEQLYAPSLFDAWWALNAPTIGQRPLKEIARAAWDAGQAAVSPPPETPIERQPESFSPEGKERRTILAALRLFRDQVLVDAKDEIVAGEWCSLEETDRLIGQLEAEETQ